MDSIPATTPDMPLDAAMSAEEQALLVEAARDRRSGLEYGCGGSTGLLLGAGIGRLTSVDSDAAWLRKLGADPRCAPALAAGRLRLVHVDIGQTGAWGWPQDASRLPHWPAYWRDPWTAAGEADLVLVDGRFRVACALNALPRLAPGGVLLVHDFWQREAYHAPLLRHAELLGTAGSLVLLAPRRPLDAALLAADLVAHGFDPR